jgi:hypothetical protein
MVTLSTPEGALVGWYVVYLEKRPGPAILMQIGVQRKAQFDRALSAVFRDMWRQGASSVKGQGMPQHLTSLSNQYCVFRHANTCTVFQSREQGVQDAIFRGQAAFSRLDGETWMHFSDVGRAISRQPPSGRLLFAKPNSLLGSRLPAE